MAESRADHIPAADAGVVAGLFSRPEDARLAVDALQTAGFDRSRIHLWTRPGPRGDKLVEASRTYKVVKGAAVGAGIGLLLALFLIALPVYGADASPVLTRIAGSVHIILAVAFAGAVAGALRGLAIGMPRADADSALHKAAAAVAVDAADNAGLATRILTERGAEGADDPTLADRVIERTRDGALRV
jgi:hypothetical protein